MVRGNPDTVLIANPGADLYGSDRMAVATVRALIAGGRKVIVTVPGMGPLVPLLEAAGAQVVECPTPIIRKGLLSFRGLLQLVLETARSIAPSVALIRRQNVGVVLVNTITPPLWLFLGRVLGRYTVCHVHEGEASISAWLKRAVYAPLVFCHRILINSAFSLEVLTGVAPRLRGKAEVIYNTVDGPTHVTPPRTSLAAPVRLLFVGRLSYRKGPHVAVSALSDLVSNGHDVTLGLLGAVFPGNEAYAEELHRLVGREGLTERVEFLGFRPSVWDTIAAYDIVVIPSTLDEPFGNTAVEAALAARPSVVSDVGGLPEAARHSTSSVLVPAGDAHALAVAVRSIIEGWTQFADDAMSDSVRVAHAFSRATYEAAIVTALTIPQKGPLTQGIPSPPTP